MSWFIFTLSGYFFAAITSLLDKFLLAGRIKEPVVYAFFVSLLSLFAIILVPFGVLPLPGFASLLFVLSGVFFLCFLITFYTAVQRSEISRVAPLVGILTSIITGIASFFFGLTAIENLSLGHVLALFLLLAGAFLIAFDLPLKPNNALRPVTLFAGVFSALSFIALKAGYHITGDFLSGFLWSRAGFLMAGLSLLLFPICRKKILTQMKYSSLRNQRHLTTGFIFLSNKVLGSLSSLLLMYATYRGSVTVVQALNGVQYAFVLLLAIPLSLRYPKIFMEKLSLWDWFQKWVAVLIIGLGMWLAVTLGIHFLFL